MGVSRGYTQAEHMMSLAPRAGLEGEGPAAGVAYARGASRRAGGLRERGGGRRVQERAVKSVGFGVASPLEPDGLERPENELGRGGGFAASGTQRLAGIV